MGRSDASKVFVLNHKARYNSKLQRKNKQVFVGTEASST